MTTFFVTGGAGFIGSAFVDKARADGHLVYVFDKAHGNDLANGVELNEAMKSIGPDWVIHLAATPGVSNGKDNGGLEACNDLFNTCQVLRAMNHSDAKRIMFVSTGSVYGDDRGRQVGFYAAGKIAAEGFIEAQCAAKNTTAVILRLGTVIGPGNAKGFTRDFVRKLKQDPKRLEVLGDGCQVKSYLHIADQVSAMFATAEFATHNPGCHNFDVSHDMAASIRECVPWVCDEMGVNPEVVYGESSSGFFGDIPVIRLDNRSLCSKTGWRPTKSIERAVSENVRWLLAHPEVFG